MKSLVKGFVIAVAMLSFAVAASAEETHTTESISMSFNYGDNTFTVTDDENKTSETELTVMLVKGDYTGDKSLAEIKSDEICYIGQAGGLSYSSLFTNLGVKYTEGGFAPGEYTLVKSGEGMTEASKTKIFLGNAVKANGTISNDIHSDLRDAKITFGTMNRTLKVYEDANVEQYIYVGVGSFPLEDNVGLDLTKLGFAVQKMVNEEKVDKGYRSLDSFTNVSDSLKNISSLTGGSIEVGIQIKGIDTDTEIVAIPYVLTSAPEAVAE